MSLNPPSNPPTVPADVARHLGPPASDTAELPTEPDWWHVASILTDLCHAVRAEVAMSRISGRLHSALGIAEGLLARYEPTRPAPTDAVARALPNTRVCPMRSALHNKPMPHAWSRPLTADGAVGYCAMCGVDR